MSAIRFLPAVLIGLAITWTVVSPVAAQETVSVSGVVLRENEGPEAGAFVVLCQHPLGPDSSCPEGTTDDDGSFSVAVPPGDYIILLEVPTTSETAVYRSDAPGGLSHEFDLADVLEVRAEPITGIEMTLPVPKVLIDQGTGTETSIPAKPAVSGRVVYHAGNPVVGATIHVCNEDRDPACVSTTTADSGHFSIPVNADVYYIAVTLESNERWYYHASSPGRLISTDRRPERTFVPVPSAEAADISVRIPQRDFARLVIRDLHRGPALNAEVKVSVCREEGYLAVLPQCLISSEATSPAGPGRILNAPVPPEPYYIRFEFVGYAVGWHVHWYYDEDSPSGISSNFLRRTTFPGANPPLHPLQIQLPDLPRSIPVRLNLNPGANLVGWPGAAISLTELARQLPQLKGIVRLPLNPDAPPEAYAVNDPDAPRITTLSRWWFYTDLDQPRSFLIDTAPDPAQPHPYGWYYDWFTEGESFLVWAGAQPVTLEQATAGLGELREPPRLLRWTGTEFEHPEAGLVRQGDLIRINSPRKFMALLPFPWQPFYVLDGPADHEWGQIAPRLQAVQAFFWERHGLIQNNFTLHYRTSPDPYYLSYLLEGRCGWSSPPWITLTCADPHSIARQYFRLLQLRMLSTNALNQRPAWLIEGMMEYAAAIYTHHAEGSSGDPLASYWETVRSGFSDERELTDLPSDFWYWGDDRDATVLSTVAVGWLVKQSGNPDALFEFLRRAFDYESANPDHDWRLAFEQAFGISVNDFHDRFAEYQANGFE